MGNDKNSWSVPDVPDVPDDVWTEELFIDRKGYSWLCIFIERSTTNEYCDMYNP